MNDKSKYKIKANMVNLPFNDEKYEYFIENINSTVYTIDENGFITFICKSVQKIFGYKVHEVLGKYFLEFIAEEDQVKAKNTFERLAIEKKGIEELHIKTKDGNLKFVRVIHTATFEGTKFIGEMGIVVDISEGKLEESKLGFELGLLKDVSEAVSTIYLGKNSSEGISDSNLNQKLIENALKEVEEGLHEILYDSAIMFYSHTLDDNIIFVSPHTKNKLSLDQNKEIIKWTDLLTDNPINIKGIKLKKNAFETGLVQEPYEIEIKNNKNNLLWFEVHEVPIVKDKKTLLIVGSFKDITARKKAEKELISSQTLLISALEMANMGAWEYDVLTDTMTLNDQYYKIHRTSIKEIGSYTMSSSEYIKRFVDPDNFQSVTREIRDAIKTIDYNYYRTYERNIIYADGKPGTFLINYKIVKDENGKTIRAIGVSQDITERKKVENYLKEREEKLAESENFLSNIVENIPNMIFVKDAKDLKFVKINKAGEKLLGLTREELLGKSDYDFFPKDQADFFVEKDREVINSNNYIEIPEERIITLKQGERILHTKKISIRDDKGYPKYLLGISEDITLHKKAEEELKASKSLLTSALEMANMGHWEYDVLTDKFTFNDLFYKMLHTTINEVGSYTMSSSEYTKRFTHPEDLEIVGSEIQLSIKTTDPNYHREFEHRIIFADGNVGSIAVRFNIVKDSYGKTIKTYGVNQDITKRKTIENELIRAKEKAEEMSKLKSNFLAVMSHELRTPLIGIVGFSDFLRQDLKDKESKEAAEIIFDSGNRLSETLNLILDLSLLENGHFDVKAEPINIVVEAQEIINTFRKFATTKGLNLNLSFSQTPLILHIDRRAIRTILNNLINNAIKFTNKGSVSTEISNNNNFIEIKVIDTGIGISKKYHKTIFDEFRQVSEGLSRNFEGIGLGLNITKKFVEKFGGEITVDSEPEKGTTFTVKFPKLFMKSEYKEEIKTKSKIISTDLNKKDIKPDGLLVDDDPLVFPILKRYSSDLVNLEWVKNGEEAINKCKKIQYNFIFMDINLRMGIDGMELTKKIRKIDGYNKIPIIASTAYAMKGDKEEFLNAGCTYYLSKPFKPEEVSKILFEILNEN